MERYQIIERSIIKTYRKVIWRRFVRALNDYDMIQEGDKIAVCISGGKDSMLLAKCMQEIQRHGKIKFDLDFIVMDPGYTAINRQRIIDNAQLLNIPIHMFESPIFDIVDQQEKNPCYVCARMRRGYLYKEAKQRGCNKIALGHHFDDVIETILMSMLYAGEYKTMMPKLHSQNFEGMELIRPLYLVKEQDIIAWSRLNDLHFLQCACHFTEMTHNDHEDQSKRKLIKKIIADLRKDYENIDINLFRSVHNVNLTTIIGYRMTNDDRIHNFLEHYDDIQSEE